MSDDNCFQHTSGINENSLVRIIDIDEDEELNCPQIISQSSYYATSKLKSTLQKCKNKLTILSTNINLFMQNWMN